MSDSEKRMVTFTMIFESLTREQSIAMTRALDTAAEMTCALTRVEGECAIFGENLDAVPGEFRATIVAIAARVEAAEEARDAKTGKGPCDCQRCVSNRAAIDLMKASTATKGVAS